MIRAKIKHLEIRDKIYIKKEDVEDYDHFASLFTHVAGTEIISNLESNDTHYLIPSNSFYKLEWDTIADERNFIKLDYQLKFTGNLRVEQQEAVDKFKLEDRIRSGILQAQCGFGKTYAACSLIAFNNTKTLVLVHSSLLFKQWIDELHKLIPEAKIGTIGSGLFSIEDITVGMYQTVTNHIPRLKNEFSTILVDESHKCPADVFSSTLNNLNAKVKIGISATPRRKDGKHIFLADYFSTFLVSAKDLRTLRTPSVKLVDTDFKFNIKDPKKEWARAINKLCADDNYLTLIANMAIQDIANGRCPLIIGDRVQMLKTLEKKIPNSICLIGNTSEAIRKQILESVGTTYKAILTTTLFDEGVSCHRLDTFYHTCPSNNTMRLEQRVGRIIREHPDSQDPLIVDFQLKGTIVFNQQRNRVAWYRQNGFNIL